MTKTPNQELLFGKVRLFSIIFNKNIEKYSNFETSISNNNANYFSLVDRDVTVETKIIGSTTLKGEDVKLTKSPLLNLNNTVVDSAAVQLNSNNNSSVFGPTITQSRNNPVKAGSKLKVTMHNDSSVLFSDETHPIGSIISFSKMRSSISASTPVNKYGVYFAGGPGMELKIISRSETEVVLEVLKDMPATDGIYRGWISSIKVVDGSTIKNGTISNIKQTTELISPDGKIINKKEFNGSGSIFGSNVETAPTPAQPQPAVEAPKAEKPSEEKVQAPNTGFEKSQNFIILAFAILGVTIAVVFRKKLAKIKI